MLTDHRKEANEKTREARVNNLASAQEQRKAECRKRVESALIKLKNEGRKINFSTLAEEAGVSSSYLYKYEDIKGMISDARNHAFPLRNKRIEPTSNKSHLAIVSRLKARIRQLESENSSLKQRVEVLAGRVIHLPDLEILAERQASRIQKLEEMLKQKEEEIKAGNVIPISRSLKVDADSSSFVSQVIRDKLALVGAGHDVGIQRLIASKEEEKIIAAIDAYSQYAASHEIKDPIKTLAKALRDEWQPSTTKSGSKQDIATSQESACFEKWYEEAVASGFLVGFPINTLPVIRGEIQVKVNRPDPSGGPYTLLGWKDAKDKWDSTL